MVKATHIKERPKLQETRVQVVIKVDNIMKRLQSNKKEKEVLLYLTQGNNPMVGTTVMAPTTLTGTSTLGRGHHSSSSSSF